MSHFKQAMRNMSHQKGEHTNGNSLKVEKRTFRMFYLQRDFQVDEQPNPSLNPPGFRQLPGSLLVTLGLAVAGAGHGAFARGDAATGRCQGNRQVTEALYLKLGSLILGACVSHI
jgi:hypothetical protein